MTILASDRIDIYKINIPRDINFNTLEIIENYPDKPWNWNSISKNPNITMKFIEKYPNKLWDWRGISKNPNITLEIIKKYSKNGGGPICQKINLLFKIE